MFGTMLVLLVIPETLVIFGFVIAFFLYGKI
jgi:F0F1-type ATP synthase membrane subunit c/vacuolar-type H+-ATPase subunit K